MAQEVVRALKKEVHYTVDEKQRQCVLIEGGVMAAEKLLGKDDLFDPEETWEREEKHIIIYILY